MPLHDGADNLREINIFSQYLVNREPKKSIVDKYVHLVKTLAIPGTEDKYLKFVLAHPSLTPYIDSYLALASPYSVLRYRLYVAFSVLESDKDYWEDFLPKKRYKLYIFYIIFVGLRSIYRFIIGAVLASYIKVFK